MKACPICHENNLPSMADSLTICPKCYELQDNKYSEYIKSRESNMLKAIHEYRGDRESEMRKEIIELKEEVAELTFELDTYRKEIERLYNSRRIKC
jgi:protein-arginine kinase activator protein McsA